MFPKILRCNAEVHGDFYGTPWESLRLSDEDDLVLDLDPQGARRVKDLRGDAVLIFVVPPSMEELERRLRERGKDPEEAIKERLADAQKELDQIHLYDYIVINDRFEEALRRLSSIVLAERCKRDRVLRR